MSTRILRAAVPAALSAMLWSGSALAQDTSSDVQLPQVSVTGTAEPSLTVPSAEGARREIEQTPGAVEVVPEAVWRDTAAATLKEVLDFTPGVWVQPKWGEDSRISIRGSGLSRNFHMRGINLFVDGVPINSADGGTDFQEIDPTAFRYTEVFKGANALRYGASTLGGAINFVSPTGYDADRFGLRTDIGAFGFRRLQASVGGHHGAFDGFLTGAWLKQDGFRDHSGGESVRGSGNLGWRINENIETRFYFNVADIQQYIPGSVTKASALSSPRTAAANNVAFNYQRNMESWRVANRTAIQLNTDTKIEFGGYAVHKDLIHPIFQFLDYGYRDFGGFARLVDERDLWGHRNRFVAGVTIAGGWVDNRQYENLAGGMKGNLLSQSTDRSLNQIVYVENSFDLSPGFALVTGIQYVDARRKRIDELPVPPDTSGEKTYRFLNPKVGLLWQAAPEWQVFANVSRSGEAPTFSELNFTNVVLADTKAQRATTFELGTRGRRPDFTWDFAVYRAHLRNEFQFFDLGGGNFQVTNADRTIHQGVEAGFGWAFWKGLFKGGEDSDRLWLNVAYTFSDFRFDDDPVWGDNELPGAPRHYLRAELLYKHPRGFYAGPTLEWVPEAYYVDNANTQGTASYALFGFRAGWDVNEHLAFFVDARNLLDKNYIASASVAAVATPASALYEPGTGRAIYAGMRARW